MCDLTDFLTEHPRSNNSKSFDDNELSQLTSYKIPSDIINFFRKEGRTTYHDDFFSTTLPQEQFQVLSEWGLNENQCFAFLKTAFGAICFSQKGKIFRLDPIAGRLYKGNLEFCNFMNLLTTIDEFMVSCYFDIYQKIERNRQLDYDEIYGMVPALPLGGSFETSKFEIVKMSEHLGFLSQLFGNKPRVI